MKLTLNVWPGFDLFTLKLELPEGQPITPATVVEKAVGGMSRWWTRKMFSQ